ncbi:unnamed protein product, partial [Phaeothamnion confervicola]
LASAVAQPTVTETQRGSTGLSGTFTVDHEDPDGPRTARFNEPAARLERKLEEMSTVDDVRVEQREYPRDSAGGWGSVAVADGTAGGYMWEVRFLKVPGAYAGFTFPPGTGNVDAIVPDGSGLSGTGASVVTRTVADGAQELGGTFALVFGGQRTESLSYTSDDVAVGAALADLSNIGVASASFEHLTGQRISGVTATVNRDAATAILSGATDLSALMAPGEMLRLGGVDGVAGYGLPGTNGETLLDPPGGVSHRTWATSGAPVVGTDNELSGRVVAGREVRIDGDRYTVRRNGAEVQELVVSAAADINVTAADPFFALAFTHSGLTGTTECLGLGSTAAEMEAALAALPTVGDGAVVVTRVGRGTPGEPYVYSIYFEGSAVRGDVNLLEVDEDVCAAASPPDDAAAAVVVVTQGGVVAYQQLTLATESGYVSGGFYRLQYGNESTSGCLEWGAAAADVTAALTALPSLSGVAVADLTFNTTGLYLYPSAILPLDDGLTVAGRLRRGDMVRIDGADDLVVEDVAADGASVTFTTTFEAASHDAGAGKNATLLLVDAVQVARSGTGKPVVEVQTLTVTATAPVTPLEGQGFFRLSWRHDGQTALLTPCLEFGASADDVRAALNGFGLDLNGDGSVDDSDHDHIHVKRDGDASADWGYGYVYSFVFKGGAGPSTVLGNVAELAVTDVGGAAGCTDVGGVVAAVSSVTFNMTEGSEYVTPSADISGLLAPGDRVRLSDAADANRIYTVAVTDTNEPLRLTERFRCGDDGCSGNATAWRVADGVPRLLLETTVQGEASWTYDVYFVHPTLAEVPTLALADEGSYGACSGEWTEYGGMRYDAKVVEAAAGGSRSKLALMLRSTEDAGVPSDDAFYRLWWSYDGAYVPLPADKAGFAWNLTGEKMVEAFYNVLVAANVTDAAEQVTAERSGYLNASSAYGYTFEVTFSGAAVRGNSDVQLAFSRYDSEDTDAAVTYYPATVFSGTGDGGAIAFNVSEMAAANFSDTAIAVTYAGNYTFDLDGTFYNASGAIIDVVSTAASLNVSDLPLTVALPGYENISIVFETTAGLAVGDIYTLLASKSDPLPYGAEVEAQLTSGTEAVRQLTLDRPYAGPGTGARDAYLVPQRFLVRSPQTEVQSITVKNELSAMWSNGSPSYR